MNDTSAQLRKEIPGDGGLKPARRFEYHVGFLEQLDKAIEEALASHCEANEGDLEELRHVREELGTIRGILQRMCTKDDNYIDDGDTLEGDAAI